MWLKPICSIPSTMHYWTGWTPASTACGIWLRTIGARTSELAQFDVSAEDGEEIGFRTEGWPVGLEELTLLVELETGAMAEISIARATADGGFTEEMVEVLKPFLPLLSSVLRALCTRFDTQDHRVDISAPRLDAFGRDRLSPREAEVIQMVLKGHSSLSISLTLDIALTTVKTHRKNAYAKLGIATQQELFNAFLEWQG